jgi:flagellar biosynthesis protein FliQ
MLFTGGGGEALVPVRSTTDRTAVSIFYAAETKLWNRTLSFVSVAGILALFSVCALFGFWKAANSF